MGLRKWNDAVIRCSEEEEREPLVFDAQCVDELQIGQLLLNM